ncbi:ABC-type Fe3+-hydroxamate transport system, periplasmic component [Halanaeroarchaeum sp. HSR-CO]|uniref:PGF-CTERM-anchored ABC transporter substrate-binding protein n=1 Tax=Halanaeroarchaeum sp. HSR-CO TaxID=2866382 RepID=UPI00217D8BAF|nr:PGF-CTERM-anchored ABC transporter substrate-binding protein [Halanaeroarchaeum sp. HSR-CO]UWG46798.1 ABC-type Fe3+-hydroxamate transport system, periplasmic component [Halanaeroarchaeum sp. HSR-CO]
MTARSRLRTILVLGLVVALVGAGAGPALAAGAVTDQASANQLDDCSFPVETTDATGETVTIDAEPETVVTLGPSAAQTMWEIGAEEKVVGVSQYASYLEGAESRTNVSGASQSFVDSERVVDLDPDLVLAPNIIPVETVQKLRDSGLTVYSYERATSLADVEEKTRLTGHLVGACEGAEKRATEMNESLETVRDRVDGEDRPRVLYYMGGGHTAGEGTFIDGIIEAAGGTNVAAEAGMEGYGQMNEEDVVEQNPEWIVTNTDIGAIPESAGYDATTAVQEEQILLVDANYVSQPAPRTVEIVEELAAAFHPASEDAAVEATETTATETTADSATTATTAAADGTTRTTTATTPGMGIPVALLAISLVGLSLRRE